MVRLGAVNADDHRELGGRYGVKGFPTIKIFGSNKNKPSDYQGTQTHDCASQVEWRYSAAAMTLQIVSSFLILWVVVVCGCS